MAWGDLSPENEQKVKGATNGDLIGNVGDRLKVDANISGVSAGSPVWDASTLIYEDMSYSRNTPLPLSYTTVYTYSGTGQLIGFLINFDNDSELYIRINIDGYYILFGSTGLYLKDVKDNDIYDIKDLNPELAMGIGLHDNAFRFHPSYPMTYNSYVTIEAKALTGKKFRAGFVKIIKFT